LSYSYYTQACWHICVMCSVCVSHYIFFSFLFFLNITATTEIYTLSLHDALPIYRDHAAIGEGNRRGQRCGLGCLRQPARHPRPQDRKSTRLNSSHSQISYAVFCLKKKK